MKQLNCDFFQLTFEFESKDFKLDEFAIAAGIKNEELEEIGGFIADIGSRKKRVKEHAHLNISLGDKKNFLRLDFIPKAFEDVDEKEPYVDNVGKWFADFFPEPVIADMWVVFKYNRTYEAILPINYPLLKKNELLKGAEVAGYEIAFPPESFIHRASISAKGNILLVFLDTKFKLPLKEFDFYKAIQMFSKFAESLVQKKELKNETVPTHSKLLSSE